MLRQKAKICYLVIGFTASFILYYYIYLVSRQNERGHRGPWNEERCQSEISMLKYQLSVITNYKTRIEALLAETRKNREDEKEKFKDVMESCVAMHQQVSLCQSQFEDLQGECKKAKDQVNQMTKELDKMHSFR